MSYLVLARKWRPRDFQQVVGQTHVLRALTNALNQARLHHAYLFAGTRGVGKTTLARILAKCLNCERGVSASPCGECSACIEIDEGRFIDLIEVDAASRTKVEDTRELLENVQYAPTRGRYKVYLIDEVHMLSGHSFNALLKTLEEPPPHVKFLLATTDPQKLPVTILSRCLQFNLKRMPVQMIAGHLKHILEREGVRTEEAALSELARAADGSMRDALSLLDQAIAYGNGEVRVSEVNEMLGTVPREHFQALMMGLAQYDAKAVMETTAYLANQSVDFSDVLADLLSVLHEVALIQKLPHGLDRDSPYTALISSLGQLLSPEDVQLFYQIALTGRRDLPLTPDPRLGFEMVLLRMLSFRPITISQIPSGDDSNLFAADESLDKTVPPKDTSTPGVSDNRKVTKIDESATEIDVRRSEVVQLNWPDVVKKLSLRGVAYALATNCSLKAWQEDEIFLALESQHAELRTKNAELRLQHALSEYFSKDLKLRIQIAEHEAETPAQLQHRITSERQLAAEQAIEKDVVVQGLRENFGAEIVPGSIKPISNSEN